jgi:hypothetical protein
VLVAAGLRTGSTWIGTALGHTENAVYVHEPDNDTIEPAALRGKLGRGRWPYVRPGERRRAYEQTWEMAFAGGAPRDGRRARLAQRAFDGASSRDGIAAMDSARPRTTARLRLATALAPRRAPHSGRTAVVKTVHATLSLDWLAERFSPRIVVVRRDPLDVVGSYVAMGWKARPQFDPAAIERFGCAVRLDAMASDDLIERTAWQVGFLAAALDDYARRHPEVPVIEHERACEQPVAALRELAVAVGLTWTAAAEEFVAGSNRPGSGYELNRVAAEQPGSWRSRLTPDEAARARDVLSAFPLASPVA